MKQQINLLIHPTHNTNSNLDLAKLADMLDNVFSKFEVKHIEIGGYEITSLSDFYVDFLCRLLQSYSENVNIITDLEITKPAIINNFNNIIVPINFFDISQKVKDNIKALSGLKNITTISYNIYCNNNKKQNIAELNKLKVKSWKILPYMANIVNKGSSSTDYEDYEKTVKEYIDLSPLMKFAFINKLEIDNIINNDNFNTLNILITPNSKYALIKYDKHNKECYEEYDTILDLDKGINDYLNKINNYCLDCKFKNRCLSNNFNFNYNGKTCSGFRNLLMKTPVK